METPDIIAMNKRLDSIMRDGVTVDCAREEIRDQIEFLCGVLEAEREHLTRLDFDEHGIIYGMIRHLKEALANQINSLTQEG